MNRDGCTEEARDLLPAFAAGTLSDDRAQSVSRHLAACTECQEELGVIRHLLLVSPPSPPPGLKAKLQARLREEAPGWSESVGSGKLPGERDVVPFRRRHRRIPAWALSAAAVVVLALGTRVIWIDRNTDMTLDPILVASDEPIPEEWLWDDGMVAGAPVFDDLSDEDLEALIEEYEG